MFGLVNWLVSDMFPLIFYLVIGRISINAANHLFVDF